MSPTPTGGNASRHTLKEKGHTPCSKQAGGKTLIQLRQDGPRLRNESWQNSHTRTNPTRAGGNSLSHIFINLFEGGENNATHHFGI